MTLTEFKKLWETDGTKLVELEKRNLHDKDELWLLLAVYLPESTYDYGRHMALIIKCNAKSKEILMHDVRNLSGEVTSFSESEVSDWFERHVGRY